MSEGVKVDGIDIQAMVREFHKTFGHAAPDSPTLVGKRRLIDRADYQQSEIIELYEALEENDLAGIMDAIGDDVYFALGTFVELGVDFYEVFRRIHAANMSKLWPEDVDVIRATLAEKYDGLTLDDVNILPTEIEGRFILQRKDTGKVLKGPDFAPPDLSDLVPTKSSTEQGD